MSFLLSLLRPSHIWDIQVRLSTVCLGMFINDFISVLFPVHVKGEFFFLFLFCEVSLFFFIHYISFISQNKMLILFELTLTIHITISLKRDA